MKFLSFLFLFSIFTLNVQFIQVCRLPRELIDEIKTYQSRVNYIIRTATSERYAGRYYRDLAEFIDKFGARMSGTSNLENAIDYLYNKTALEGLTPRRELVIVPKWTRITESATLVQPRKKNLRIAALGFSPPTIPTGYVSELIVVSSFTEMRNKEKLIRGKIVLLNFEPSNYEDDLQYQFKCAEKAFEVKALAVLVRSVPRKGCNPHVGRLNYESGKLIPAASICAEDSNLLARLYKKRETLVIHLLILTTMEPPTASYNLIFDYKGTEHPDQLITISGHIDSWDLGEGVMDNAAGAFLALHTILLLKFMHITPKRTIRGIMWTGKEQGMLGSKNYMLTHVEEIKNWTIALSSDEGLFDPKGFKYRGGIRAFCILKEIMNLFKEYFPGLQFQYDTVNLRGDIYIFRTMGVPVMETIGDNEFYYSHIHSVNDALINVDLKKLDKNLAIFAGLVYVLSNISKKLPRVWEPLKILAGNVIKWDVNVAVR